MDDMIKKYGPKALATAGMLLVAIGTIFKNKAEDAELDRTIDEKIQKAFKDREID